MKLRKYIKSLKKFLKANGDMDCWYSIDDEGNGYETVYGAGTLFYKNKEDDWRTDEVYGYEEFREMAEDGELNIEDFEKICVVN